MPVDFSGRIGYTIFGSQDAQRVAALLYIKPISSRSPLGPAYHAVTPEGWAGSIQLPGTHSRVHARHLSQGSKPLLFFVRDAKTFKPAAWIEDTYVSEAREKEQHPWQQSVGCARYFIEQLTKAGDLVCDPFLGGGTSGVAALDVGRDFIGIEVDKASFVEGVDASAFREWEAGLRRAT